MQRLATVTYRTAPVSSIVSGNHREHLQLYIISSPSSSVVLGLPWLRLSNPHIDWSSASISSRSVFCHSHCFGSAATTVRPSVSITPSSPNRSLVPPAFRDLATVVSKERAPSLPPHSPHDCAIDLLLGAPLPSRQLSTCHTPKWRLWMITLIHHSFINNPALLVPSRCWLLFCGKEG